MFRRITLLAVMVGLAFGAEGRTAIRRKADYATTPLRLSVRVDGHSYQMGDILTLEAQLTNVSDDALFLNEWDLCWNFARGLVLRVIDSRGSDVRTDVLLDCVPPPPRAGDVYRFVKIDSGRFYGSVTEFRIRDLVNQPGEYNLDVKFESSLSAKWVSEFLRNDPISKLPLWTIEKPPLKAPRIHITVMP